MNTQHNQKEEMPGMRLMALLENHLLEILDKERDNQAAIHLYSTGTHWVAFERSAYQLLRLSPRIIVTPMSLTIYPFPIVMASLTDRELRSSSRMRSFLREKKDYGWLAVPELSLSGYKKWHREEVGDFPVTSVR
ncbi:hypothetical protein [uncultured Parabacteroides sp.]|uniref:hypothetical protein n=1 Tax=uncultured Parabacteroides sp. TaxID=512312 RepID=UPI00261D1ED8|nr:hypothetical protein [uncultured Parabacteroides sp.]